jgi:hypothetical protein
MLTNMAVFNRKPIGALTTRRRQRQGWWIMLVLTSTLCGTASASSSSTHARTNQDRPVRVEANLRQRKAGEEYLHHQHGSPYTNRSGGALNSESDSNTTMINNAVPANGTTFHESGSSSANSTMAMADATDLVFGPEFEPPSGQRPTLAPSSRVATTSSAIVGNDPDQVPSMNEVGHNVDFDSCQIALSVSDANDNTYVDTDIEFSQLVSLMGPDHTCHASLIPPVVDSFFLVTSQGHHGVSTTPVGETLVLTCHLMQALWYGVCVAPRHYVCPTSDDHNRRSLAASSHTYLHTVQHCTTEAAHCATMERTMDETTATAKDTNDQLSAALFTCVSNYEVCLRTACYQGGAASSDLGSEASSGWLPTGAFTTSLVTGTVLLLLLL